MSDNILKKRESAPWDYLRFGFISEKNYSTARGACFASVSLEVFSGCEVFFDRSTPCCLAGKLKGECYTGVTKRIEHSASDIAFVNYLVTESPWSEVFLNSPEDVLANGGMYRTDRHNQFILEAAYLLRDVAEQPAKLAQWHKLAEAGYNKTAAMLFCQMFGKNMPAHTSISCRRLGVEGCKKVLAFDTKKFTKDTANYMNAGKVLIYNMEGCWDGIAGEHKCPAPKKNSEFGNYYYFSGDPSEFEEFCQLNKWNAK